MEKNLYREKSLKRISSPDQLDEHIKIARPSVVMLIGALALVLVGAAVWGFFGHMPTVELVTGVYKDGRVLCFMTPEQAYNLAEGMEVRAAVRSVSSDEYGSLLGVVGDVGDDPLSVEEATAIIGDAFAAENAVASNWTVAVTVNLTPDAEAKNGFSWSSGKGREVTLKENMVCDVTVILRQTRPIDLLFGE